MEVRSIIKFNNVDYCVHKVFYRSKGSRDQILTEKLDSRTEERRTFYLVRRNGNYYWVKEYTKPDYGHSIKYEYEETARLRTPSLLGYHNISTVEMIALEDNRLLMEYLNGYEKLLKSQLSQTQKLLIKELIKLWIKEHDVHDYDLCANNIMIKISKLCISLRLIDFEYSIGVNQSRWNQFLGSIK